MQRGDNTEVVLSDNRRVKSNLAFGSGTKKDQSEAGKQLLILLSETSPDFLEEYLSDCLDFLESLTSHPAMLFLPAEMKAKLEVTMVNVLSVSQLKTSMSCLTARSAAKMVNISSHLLVTTSIREQAESPLLFALVKFQ